MLTYFNPLHTPYMHHETVASNGTSDDVFGSWLHFSLEIPKLACSSTFDMTELYVGVHVDPGANQP